LEISHVTSPFSVSKQCGPGWRGHQASLAWLLARSPVILPIPGTSRVDHLEDNVGAANIKLTREEMQKVG
jgi:aryl-alcohol dehydrogenase-like predicted oxidoreductase